MKYLISPEVKQYKANLHCHTTLSDGQFTPLEIKKLYQKNGYSIVAFSDHEKLIPHPELEDENFIPLTAVEYMWNEYEITPNNASEYEKPSNISVANKKVNELKDKIKSLGIVNVNSIEEYKKTKSRYEFMNEQRAS